MLKIRFQRTGRKNDPSFRIVVGEHTGHPKKMGHVAAVGSHNPRTKHTVIDAEAVKGWMAKGAKASGVVHNLLVTQGIVEGKKANVRGTKVAPPKEEAKTDASPAEPAPETSSGEATEPKVI